MKLYAHYICEQKPASGEIAARMIRAMRNKSEFDVSAGRSAFVTEVLALVSRFVNSYRDFTRQTAAAALDDVKCACYHANWQRISQARYEAAAEKREMLERERKRLAAA